MKFGASFFFTDYSISPGDFAVALEERGFESLWAPEHSHFPVEGTSPFPNGGPVPKHYYDVMDPFVTLTAAGAVTKNLMLGTGVCLVNQRDPIQTAKLVASLDFVSKGRFLFGIGGGFLAIPVLVLFYNVTPAKAGGTSLFIITVNTLTGFIAHWNHWNEVQWRYPLIIAIVAIVVAQLASKRASKVAPVILKRTFAAVVFSIAIFQLIETWVLKSS